MKKTTLGWLFDYSAMVFNNMRLFFDDCCGDVYLHTLAFVSLEWFRILYVIAAC